MLVAESFVFSSRVSRLAIQAFFRNLSSSCQSALAKVRGIVLAGSRLENYIVRVYYRDPQIPGLLKGVVELVTTGGRVSFHDSKELLGILESAQSPAAARPKRSRPVSGRRTPAKRKPPP